MITNKKNRLIFSLIWLSIVILSLVYIRSNLSVVSDMQQFMPDNSNNKRLQVLLHETQKGTVSNLILVQMSGASPEYLSKLNKKLKFLLLKNDYLFESIVNGENDWDIESFRSLIKYRYLLAQPKDFSVNGLTESIKAILDTYRNGASGEIIKYLLLDPQKTFSEYLMAQGNQAKTSKVNGVWFVADKSKTLLMIQLKVTGFNLDLQQAGIAAIKNAVKELDKTTGVKLVLSGPGTIAVAIRESIQTTIKQVSWVLTIVVIILFWFGYRSIRLAFIAGIPLITSIIVAITITQLIFGELHGIVLAFGITMLGVCLDYPLHLFSHINKHETSVSTLSRIWPTLRLGVVTSILSYVALIGTGFSGLTQLAVFSATGLIIALVVTRWLIPVWVSASWVNKRSVFISYPLTQKNKVIASLMLIGLPLLILGVEENIWSNDISHISPIPSDMRETDYILRQELNATDVNHMFLVGGKNIQDVLDETNKLKLALKPALAKGYLSGIYAATDILPTRKDQQNFQSLLPDRDLLKKNVSSAMENLPFKSDTFVPFINSVVKNKTSPIIDYAYIISSPLGYKLKSMLFKQSGNWYSIIRVSGVRDEKVFSDWLQNSPNIISHHISMHEATNALMDKYLQSSWLRLLGILLLVVLIILWQARKRKVAVWLLVPVFAGVVMSLAVQILLGNLINLFHILSLLLVIGMGLDYGLFFNRDWDNRNQLQDRTHAILISAITTIIAFGTLGLSDIPILTAMGQTVSVGIMTCFFAAKWVAIPKATL